MAVGNGTGECQPWEGEEPGWALQISWMDLLGNAGILCLKRATYLVGGKVLIRNDVVALLSHGPPHFSDIY